MKEEDANESILDQMIDLLADSWNKKVDEPLGLSLRIPWTEYLSTSELQAYNNFIVQRNEQLPREPEIDYRN